MKIGIVGAGAVGTACQFAMALRGSAREIVVVNRNFERAKAPSSTSSTAPCSRQWCLCERGTTPICAMPRWW